MNKNNSFFLIWYQISQDERVIDEILWISASLWYYWSLIKSKFTHIFFSIVFVEVEVSPKATWQKELWKESRYISTFTLEINYRSLPHNRRWGYAETWDRKRGEAFPPTRVFYCVVGNNNLSSTVLVLPCIYI